MNKNFSENYFVIKANSLDDFFNQLENSSAYPTACKTLLSLYKLEPDFPDMSHFRLGPNMFKNSTLYVIILVSKTTDPAEAQLIAHGITTDILWNQQISDLPEGWQGAVRRSYENSLNNLAKNTLVGLYIRVESQFKQQGWSEKIILAMKSFSLEHAYESLIIPLRLPKRFSQQYAKMAYKKFISLKRDDGQFLDHWLRLHTRLGAKILDVCLSSHQHAMNLNDFLTQFSTKKIIFSGKYLAEKKGLWYTAYIDKKRRFALINQECTWVRHSTAANIVAST